jgi:hypothetical protein
MIALFVKRAMFFYAISYAPAVFLNTISNWSATPEPSLAVQLTLTLPPTPVGTTRPVRLTLATFGSCSFVIVH